MPLADAAAGSRQGAPPWLATEAAAQGNGDDRDYWRECAAWAAVPPTAGGMLVSAWDQRVREARNECGTNPVGNRPHPLG